MVNKRKYVSLDAHCSKALALKSSLTGVIFAPYISKGEQVGVILALADINPLA